MASRRFASLESFAGFCVEVAAIQHAALDAVSKTAADVMGDHVKAVFGDNTKLAPLAQSTQDERVRLGYTPNDPLLRTGELLRASIETDHAALGNEAVAALGSDEPVMVYHEFGYVNARTGTTVPPRPAIQIGVTDALPKLETITEVWAGASAGIIGVSEALAELGP